MTAEALHGILANMRVDSLREVLGHPALVLTAPDGAEALISLYGAHVLSWRPSQGAEQLYLSPRAEASQGAAIRGGVPVIFPQFDRRGPEPGLPRHGFARTQRWKLAGTRAGERESKASFVLTDGVETRASFPHAFALRLDVSVGENRLKLTLSVQNTGTTRWAFSAALHTYLAVSDVGTVTLRGLRGGKVWDSVKREGAIEQELEKRIEGEVDQIHARAFELLLSDGSRRLQIQHDQLWDAVIWNPGPEKGAALRDMPFDGYRRMLCVEAGRVLEPVRLEPGAAFTGSQTLTLLSP